MTFRAEKQLSKFLSSDAMSDEFFMDIVERKLNISRDEFKLRLVLVTPATGKNENFVSVVFRAQIKIEFIQSKLRESIDVIIKALCVEEKIFEDFQVFQRERFVYENILEKFEQLWLEGAHEKIKFSPKCFKVEQDPYKIIVLEDMSRENFEVHDRKVGLNFENSLKVLKKLAKFHAAGAVSYQQVRRKKCLLKKTLKKTNFFLFFFLCFKTKTIDASLDRKISMKSLAGSGPIMTGFTKIFQTFSESVASFEGCEKFAERIAKWDIKKLLSAWMVVTKPMKCGFYTLNHGDLWTNNFLLSPSDVTFIDYQMTFYGTPSADVIYFFLTSVRDDIKTTHFDELVELYYHELITSLKTLSYDQIVPSLDELHDDMLEIAAFGEKHV